MRDKAAWMHEWRRQGEPDIWYLALQALAWRRIVVARRISRQWLKIN